MKRILWIGLLLAGFSSGEGQEVSVKDEPMKVVIHVSVPESGIQGAGMKNVVNLLKDAPDTRVEVICHGAGIDLVEQTHTDHAEAVRSLIKKGVKFVACENTRRSKSIQKEDLLPGVDTVRSGAVEVVRKPQREGYAYFNP